jgi:hypothetical protein
VREPVRKVAAIRLSGDYSTAGTSKIILQKYLNLNDG